jgi:hypothetical protein
VGNTNDNPQGWETGFDSICCGYGIIWKTKDTLPEVTPVTYLKL